jgi:hypothetical protein
MELEEADGVLADQKLKGVGPATASAVLSVVEPDVFPFMRCVSPGLACYDVMWCMHSSCTWGRLLLTYMSTFHSSPEQPFSDELLEAMADIIGARVYTHAHYARCRFLQ